ncbi:hypothetical protein TMA_167 [Thermus phage TMA]|uniref:hypothetical protein n=1 Tax=Thermus phage TMA TaxID=699370 RepID=UPI00021AAE10|nr:hypothetical protein TMA_167 [Thermus phage TMA]BAK53855.1 hypothetical protein TMA_167 [Thermus phage TMA]
MIQFKKTKQGLFWSCFLCYNSNMTEKELNQVIFKKFEELRDAIKTEFYNSIDEKYVEQIRTNKTFYNSEELANLVSTELKNQFEQIFQEAENEFKSFKFYLFDDAVGREDLNFNPGLCKTSKVHIILEGQFKTVDCGFLVLENSQILNKFIESFIRRTFGALIVRRLNEISAKIVEENAIISTDSYDSA